MKPIKNSIPIRELQTLLRQWRRNGLREAALLKVLELYLGIPEYMNAKGEYPSHFFYDLAMSLKVRTVVMMLESVKMSGAFGWKAGDNRMNMSSFYSPLWKEGDVSPTRLPAKTQVLPADLHANLQEGNIISNHISTPPEVNPSEEGRRFFHEIKTNPQQKAEFLEPLIAHFMQQEAGVPREEACADLVYLVNELLIPHFIAQERFLRMKHNGRLSWLRNLLKTAHGKELVKKAAEAGRQRRTLKRQQAQTEVMQNNRPLSPYEWMDPKSGTRFYEDALEGRVVIPADAPPRPGDSAFWNVIQRSWMFDL